MPRRNELAMTDSIEMKSERIIILFQLQKQILQQLHSNCMGTGKKMRLLVHESVYWLNMNADIENTMKYCATYQDYRQTQQHEKNTA